MTINKYTNKLLPNNYVSISESIIGLSSIIGRTIKKHNRQLTFDKLWKKFELLQNESKGLRYHKPTDVLLALNFLYMISVIDLQDNLIYIKNYDN